MVKKEFKKYKQNGAISHFNVHFQIYILKLHCLYSIIKSRKNKYKYLSIFWHLLQGQIWTKKKTPSGGRGGYSQKDSSIHTCSSTIELKLKWQIFWK